MLIAALLLCAARAHARPAEVHLVWQRPPASLCPTRAALEADVQALMGRKVFTTRGAARIVLRGVVEETAEGVRVRIEASNARGELIGTRELSAPAAQCASLRDAIGLVLTLFIEHEEPLPQTGPALGFGAELALAQVPMPRMALAMGPALQLAFGSAVQLSASAAYWLPVTLETARGVGASLQAVSLELRGCARAWQGLGLCTGVEGGALIVAPLELQGPARQARLLAHGLLEASWELALGALRVDLAAGALLALSRPELSYMRADGARVALYRPQLAGMNFRVTLIILTE